jgi:hypothetical protein
VALLALSFVSCRGGCGSQPAARAPDRTLAQLPRGARFVVSVDVARIRATPLWTRLSALAADDPQDRKRILALKARTGLDPLRQIHRIVAAFPDDARSLGQYAVVIDGEGFEESRLVAYAREEGEPRGLKIEARPHEGRTLWVGGPDGTAGFFVGKTRFVLGAGGWAEAMADLADGRSGSPGGDGGPGGSAAQDPELSHLVGRIDPARALWFAAVVPLDLRRALVADPARDSAASVTRMAAAVDLGPGLTAELVADLSNAADARALVARIQTTVREAKRNAQVLVMGLAPYLDALTVTAEGPQLRVTLTLAESQVKDLLDRVAGILRLSRGQGGPGKKPGAR